MKVELKASKLLERTMQSERRVLIHVGGTRSGKTFAISQYLVLRCLKETLVVSYIRKTLPALKASAFRDFREVMIGMGIWDDRSMNMNEMIYNFKNGSIVEFLSIDDPQKFRGRKRDIAFLNEANEITKTDYDAIETRTSQKVIIDLNPSESNCWVYDLEDSGECDVIHSTFMDNPFLPESIRNSILSRQENDPEFWKVFGLGQRGSFIGLVYPHWNSVSSFPVDCDEVVGGVDFGYNDPSVLIRCGFRGDELYVQELMYETELTSTEIAERVASLIGRVHVYCDSAEPDKIEDLSRAGVKVHKARKDILAGIQSVKSYKLFVVGESVNLIRELGSYRWAQDRQGKPTDTPTGEDHLLDAMRYAVYNAQGSRAPWKYAVGRI